MGDEKKLSKKKNIVLCIVSLVILCVLLFPIYWIVVTSLKTEQEIFQIPPSILAEGFESEILYGSGRER